MIRAKPIVIAIVALLLLSFVWDLVTLWWEPSSREARPTSYSARAGGYRGLYDLLNRFDVPVERSLLPPSALFRGDRRVLLLDPPMIWIEREKAEVARMAEWVKEGGELVLVTDRLEFARVYDEFVQLPSSKRIIPEDEQEWSTADRILMRQDLLMNMGIEDVAIRGPEFNAYAEDDEWEYGETFRQVRVRTVKADRTYAIEKATGPFAAMTEGIEEIQLARGDIRSIVGDGVDAASGVLSVRRQGSTHDDGDVIAAAFDVDEGTLILVSEPILFMNTGIGEGENAAIVFAIAGGDGARPVVMDEYYKGGLVTGNPSVMFTIYPYGIILGVATLLAVLWSWSRVMRFGPPLADVPPARRSIIEYVDAMARLYRRGGKAHFALRACRRGLIEEFRLAMFLPAGTGESAVTTRLERIAPDDAAHVRGVLAQIDQYIANPKELNERTLQQLQERLESCRTIMNRFRQKAHHQATG